MPCCKRKNISEEEINAVINNILRNDSCGNRNANYLRKEKKNMHQSDSIKCQIGESKESNNGIESSTRFSIRVMEAMRSLQRNRNRSLTSSNIEDIAKYIETNYRSDGDLEAQVRTVLSRISSQGFIMKIGNEDYQLVGPFANYMNNVQSHQISNSSRLSKRKCRSRSRSRRSISCVCCSKKRKGRKERLRKGGKKKRPSKKEIKNPESKKHGRDSSKHEDRHQSRKSKNLKRKNISQKFKEDYRPGSSTSSFITCCEEFSPENSAIGKKMCKSGLDVREGQCGPSHKMNESISRSSEEESSDDSVYQELKTKNSKAAGRGNKDLKRWIKNCRRESTHNCKKC